MELLKKEIRNCTICLPYLEHGVNPVIAANPRSKIAIDVFYNPNNFALIPMGFCYPGKGKTGDLAPRSECAPTWHSLVLSQMQSLELIILIGGYAQKYYLEEHRKRTLTDTVKYYQGYLPKYLPLPHPSPRNNIWLKKNDWFVESLVPELKEIIKKLIQE